MATSGFTHFDADGKATMVDVTEKAETARMAIAHATVTMAPETLDLIIDGQIGKGDVLAVARLAGITGAKRTSDLIPLCHPLRISKVAVDLEPDPANNAVQIEATVKATDKTGVEMEALTAASVAALTVYDMCKSVDRAIVLGPIRLVYKAGGKSGTYDIRGEQASASRSE